MDQENLAIIRQSYANAALGHKIQEVASSRKDKASKFFKWAEIVVIGIVLSLLVAQTQNMTDPIYSYIGAGLTVVEILVLLIKQSFHFDEDVVAHKNAASRYMILRDRYKSLIADIINQRIGHKEVIRQRDSLMHEYQLIAQLSLPTTNADYPEAMKRLKLEEDDQNIWSDAQIDHLLPKEFRKKQ